MKKKKKKQKKRKITREPLDTQTNKINEKMSPVPTKHTKTRRIGSHERGGGVANGPRIVNLGFLASTLTSNNTSFSTKICLIVGFVFLHTSPVPPWPEFHMKRMSNIILQKSDILSNFSNASQFRFVYVR